MSLQALTLDAFVWYFRLASACVKSLACFPPKKGVAKRLCHIIALRKQGEIAAVCIFSHQCCIITVYCIQIIYVYIEIDRIGNDRTRIRIGVRK